MMPVPRRSPHSISHPGLRRVSRIKGRTHVSTRPRATPLLKISLAPQGASTHVAKSCRASEPFDEFCDKSAPLTSLPDPSRTHRPWFDIVLETARVGVQLSQAEALDVQRYAPIYHPNRWL